MASTRESSSFFEWLYERGVLCELVLFGTHNNHCLASVCWGADANHKTADAALADLKRRLDFLRAGDTVFVEAKDSTDRSLRSVSVVTYVPRERHHELIAAGQLVRRLELAARGEYSDYNRMYALLDALYQPGANRAWNAGKM